MQAPPPPETLPVPVLPASPSVVGSGNLFGADCKVEGPSPLPLTMNIAPCAIPELGSAGGSQLAALTTPLMDGAAASVAAHPRANAVRLNRRIVFLRSQIILFGGYRAIVQRVTSLLAI